MNIADRFTEIAGTYPYKVAVQYPRQKKVVMIMTPLPLAK